MTLLDWLADVFTTDPVLSGAVVLVALLLIANWGFGERPR